MMPLYMDVHTIDHAISVDDVSQAHQADLQSQEQYDVRYLRYWVDEQHGKVFCLVEAPSSQAARHAHVQAKRLVANEVFQVQEGV